MRTNAISTFNTQIAQVSELMSDASKIVDLERDIQYKRMLPKVTTHAIKGGNKTCKYCGRTINKNKKSISHKRHSTKKYRHHHRKNTKKHTRILI